MTILEKVNQELLYDQAILVLNTYLRKDNIFLQISQHYYSKKQNKTKIRTGHISTNNQKENKLWHVHMLEYYSVIKE